MRSLNYWRRILYLHPKLNSDFRVSKYFNFREKCCKFWILSDITLNLEVKKPGYIFPNIVIFFVFLEKYCQNLSIIQNKQIWNMCIAFWWCNSIHNCPPGCSTYFIWWLERCRLAFMWLMMHNTIFE